MGKGNPRQLLLGVKLDDAATVGNFYPSDANSGLLRQLEKLWRDRAGLMLYLWGQEGAGKTHLLQAACLELSALGGSVIYLPLGGADELEPEVLDGLETLDLVCLDDLDYRWGDPVWERALFGLYNRCQESACSLLVAADTPPAQASLRLADLKSRLQSFAVYQLYPLADGDKAAMLRLRARGLGIELPDAVLEYILQRSQRSVPALVALLETLDRESLEMKRRVTVPLIRQVMGW